MPITRHSSRLARFWHERVLGLIIAQFTQGVTPQKIALTIALGFNLGIFPILGATTFLCAAGGICLKLNQPVIQLVNWLVSPLQLTLVLVFVRIGETLVRAQPLYFSMTELVRKFHESPAKFMKEFGAAGAQGILAWSLITPIAATVIYFLALPPLVKLSQLKNAD